MTQKLRWLAALALLLAFGAGALRAEEEDEEVRPAAHTARELLAPPRVADPAPIVVAPAPPWAPFIVPNPLAGPCPVPMPVGMAGYPNGPVFIPCPCMGGACPAGCCGGPQPENLPQYVVTAKLVKGDDEDAEVTACPRITVVEGQPATFHLQGYETSKQRSSLQIQMTVNRQGQGAQMNLALTEASSYNGERGLRSHNETTEERCNVAFGKPYKMDLKPGARLEVTVTEVETEQRVHQAACDGACPATRAAVDDDESDTPMDTVGVVINCLGQIINDAATGALGWAFSTDDDMDLTPTAYLEPPPPFVAPSPVCPKARETAAATPTAICPGGCVGCGLKGGSCCTQCAATEAVKTFDVHVRTDAAHDRKCVEITDGTHTTNATADHIVIEENCIHLEGHVRIDSGDASAEMDKCPLRFCGRLRVHICD